MPDSLRIESTPASVKWGFFDAATPAFAEVESGAEVVIETISGEPSDIPEDPRFSILAEHREVLAKSERGHGPHPLTGPVAVKGAAVGSILQVDVLEVALRQDWGWALILPLLGTLPEDFPDPVRRHFPIDIAKGEVALPWQQKPLPLKPFFGVMGVAPPPAWGRITTTMPRAHGGNMDNKELGAGASIYFPVFVEGGMFSVGDGHGVQGDGEVSVTAVETALTGRFRLSARDDMRLTQPRAESAEAYITMGFDEDLDDAVKAALRDMIRWLGERHGLSRADAYMLCSFAADMRVTQTVNIVKGAHCVLAKSVLA